MSTEREIRVFAVDALEVRAEGEDAAPVIAGHAAVFDQWTDLGPFRERVAAGAFRDSLKDGADVRALFNHNPDHIIGRTKSGTLRLKEDKVGLAAEIDPPDTQFARDLVTSINRGDVDQMSFGFQVPQGGDAWAEGKDGKPERTITRAGLFDVSPVTFAAYPQTDVAVRSLDGVAAEGRRRLEEAAAPSEDSERAKARAAARERKLQLLELGIK